MRLRGKADSRRSPSWWWWSHDFGLWIPWLAFLLAWDKHLRESKVYRELWRWSGPELRPVRLLWGNGGRHSVTTQLHCVCCIMQFERSPLFLVTHYACKKYAGEPIKRNLRNPLVVLKGGWVRAVLWIRIAHAPLCSLRDSFLSIYWCIHPFSTFFLNATTYHMLFLPLVL